MQLLVEDEHRLAVGDDLDRGRWIVLEPHLAGPGDEELALPLLLVGVELDELAVHGAHAGQLGGDVAQHALFLLGQRLRHAGDQASGKDARQHGAAGQEAVAHHGL